MGDGYAAADSTSVPPLSVDPDDDDDDQTDAQEAIAGTDANDAESVFTLSGISADESGLVLRWSSVAGREYSVWSSASIGGSSTCIESNILADPPVNTYLAAIPSAQAFYRVHVSWPAAP